MNKNKQLDRYLIIDWGTSNFRIFLIGKNGDLLNTMETNMGLLQIAPESFSVALQNFLTSWLPNYQNLPIFMAGMVGSANGWFSVDYVETQTDMQKLSNNAFSFQLPWGAEATIIPGIMYRDNKAKTQDVMRGEEVQIFGLINECNATNLKVILPGTHSKHVSVKAGEITEFSTYMTGELFSIISQNSILGKNLPHQEFDTITFNLGVLAGQTTQLTQALFQVRTQKLFNKISEIHVESYLSGILIGNELQNVTQQAVYLIGNHSLCNKYQLACNELNIPATYINGDTCFLSGMKMLIQNIFLN